MLNLHKRYCREKFVDGHLVEFTPVCNENFNFAYDVVDEIASKQPTRRAMLWCNDEGEERTFTFSDMKLYSDMTANLLKSLGVSKGDKVMLILKRRYEFWYFILALHKLGAVAVPVSNLLTPKDLIYRFSCVDIKGIVCFYDKEIINNVECALSVSKALDFKILVNGGIDGWLNFSSLLFKQDKKFKKVNTNVTDPILLYFTSGTTGMPKMVLHDNSYPLGHILTAKYWQKVVPDGLHFTISDTGWMKSMWGKLYGQWFMEAGIFVYDFKKFTPSDLLPLFSKYNLTTFCAPPTIYKFFIKEDLTKYDLSSLTKVTVAGEALSLEVSDQFFKATGLRLMEGFGQSETSLVLFNMAGGDFKPGSIGKPSPAYKVDLIDANGKTTKTGEIGEIVIKTDVNRPYGMFSGYYLDDEKTREVWNNNIYHTGDMAWRDNDGYFWYTGRKDNIIKSSGYRIGPFEIESVIMELPYVLECLVTGVPDEIRGQIVKATVVLANGYRPSDELKKDLQMYVKKQTAPYKYPRVVEFVNEISKTISGKIKRFE